MRFSFFLKGKKFFPLWIGFTTIAVACFLSFNLFYDKQGSPSDGFPSRHPTASIHDIKNCAIKYGSLVLVRPFVRDLKASDPKTFWQFVLMRPHDPEQAKKDKEKQRPFIKKGKAILNFSSLLWHLIDTPQELLKNWAVIGPLSENVLKINRKRSTFLTDSLAYTGIAYITYLITAAQLEWDEEEHKKKAQERSQELEEHVKFDFRFQFLREKMKKVDTPSDITNEQALAYLRLLEEIAPELSKNPPSKKLTEFVKKFGTWPEELSPEELSPAQQQTITAINQDFFQDTRQIWNITDVNIKGQLDWSSEFKKANLPSSFVTQYQNNETDLEIIKLYTEKKISLFKMKRLLMFNRYIFLITQVDEAAEQPFSEEEITRLLDQLYEELAAERLKNI